MEVLDRFDHGKWTAENPESAKSDSELKDCDDFALKEIVTEWFRSRFKIRRRGRKRYEKDFWKMGVNPTLNLDTDYGYHDKNPSNGY